MPDFSQPGSDGVAPFPLTEWKRGVVYTVRPEILEPLERGRVYRISTIVRRKAASEETFAELYRRASDFCRLRAGEVRCSSEGEPLHSWIASHTWGSHEIGPHGFKMASIALGLLFPEPGQSKPTGETEPPPAALLAPGGATMEMLAKQYADDPGYVKRIAEIYNDFDFAPEPGPAVFSYGEYIGSAEGVDGSPVGLDFEPFVRRAESRARWRGGPLNIIGREWFCATHPDLAVIHVYFDELAQAGCGANQFPA